jgi:hypothetical protein
MIQNVNFWDFRSAFENSDRKNQFSYDALGLIFDYLEQIEDDTGEQIELDVIAICCDYAESDADDLINSYDIFEDDVPEDEGERNEAIEQYLQDETIFIGRTDLGSFVYAQF